MEYRNGYEWTRTEQGQYIRYTSKLELIAGISSVVALALILGWLIPRLDNPVMFIFSFLAVMSLLCSCMLFGLYLRERVVFDE